MIDKEKSIIEIIDYIGELVEDKFGVDDIFYEVGLVRRCDKKTWICGVSVKDLDDNLIKGFGVVAISPDKALSKMIKNVKKYKL